MNIVNNKVNLIIEGYIIIFNSIDTRLHCFDEKTIIEVLNPIYLLFEHNQFNKKGIVSELKSCTKGVLIRASIFKENTIQLLQMIEEGIFLSAGLFLNPNNRLSDNCVSRIQIREVSLVKNPFEKGSRVNLVS